MIFDLNVHLKLKHGMDISYREMPEVVEARSKSEKERVGVFILYQSHNIYYSYSKAVMHSNAVHA